MQHDWIMDVLEDVRSFGQRNDMPALAEHMTAALALAAAELERRRAAAHPPHHPGGESQGD